MVSITSTFSYMCTLFIEDNGAIRSVAREDRFDDKLQFSLRDNEMNCVFFFINLSLAELQREHGRSSLQRLRRQFLRSSGIRRL